MERVEGGQHRGQRRQPGCDGLDPQSSGCASSGVTTPWADGNPSPGSGSWSVQSKYNIGCRSAWTKITIDDYLPTCCGSITVRIDRLVWTPYGYYSGSSYYKTVGAGLEGSWWTPMVTAAYGDQIRACYYWSAGMGGYYGPWYAE